MFRLLVLVAQLARGCPRTSPRTRLEGFQMPNGEASRRSRVLKEAVTTYMPNVRRPARYYEYKPLSMLLICMDGRTCIVMGNASRDYTHHRVLAYLCLQGRSTNAMGASGKQIRDASRINGTMELNHPYKLPMLQACTAVAVQTAPPS